MNRFKIRSLLLIAGFLTLSAPAHAEPSDKECRKYENEYANYHKSQKYYPNGRPDCKGTNPAVKKELSTLFFMCSKLTFWDPKTKKDTAKMTEKDTSTCQNWVKKD